MKYFWVVILLLWAGCQVIGKKGTELAPLPGWRSKVSKLLIEDADFPVGWARMRDWPKGSLTDETINNVYRSWWGKAQGTGEADQTIWRAYTITDSQKLYDKLRESQFEPNRSLYPGTIFIPFEPPSAIDFQSKVADEFYLACGWWDQAYCEVVARYRNYVTDMRLDLEAEHEGHVTHGLIYIQIEAAVKAMDTKFAEFLNAFPLATLSP